MAYSGISFFNNSLRQAHNHCSALLVIFKNYFGRAETGCVASLSLKSTVLKGSNKLKKTLLISISIQSTCLIPTPQCEPELYDSFVTYSTPLTMEAVLNGDLLVTLGAAILG